MEFKNEFTYRKFLDAGKEAEFDKLFDDAVDSTKKFTLGKRFPIYINGKEVHTRDELVERSPIDGTLIGRFQKGTKEEAANAVNAAKVAFAEWGAMDYRDRIKIFRKAAHEISSNKFHIAAILSIENGKTRYESIGEVDEGIDFINYYCTEMEKNKGFIRKSALKGTKSKVAAGFQGAPEGSEKVSIELRPYGVFGVIAPFNFPISISIGMSAAAMISGNTVVFKPSSTDNMTMLTGLTIYQAFRAAGLPAGVFNYVTGPGSEVGAELSANKDVSGIAFTGSRETGMGMIASNYLNKQQKVFVVEMGGKNPVIVSRSADLNKAASGIMSAAFGFSGQKCSAASRVYVHESIKEEFIHKLAEKTRTLSVGNPLSKWTFMGPLASRKSLDRYNACVEQLKKTEHVITGGKKVDVGLDGVYVEPVIAEVDQENPMIHKELFLPILLIDTYKKFEEAVQKANDTEYGLCAGLYSAKKTEIDYFLDHIESGVVYVNREVSATTGAIVGFHTFVGWKDSGLTGKGTGSKNYLQQFMREQSRSISK